MKFSELIDHAIECIKTYNEVIKTLDSHGDEYVKKVSTSCLFPHNENCYASPSISLLMPNYSNSFFLFISSKTLTSEYL